MLLAFVYNFTSYWQPGDLQFLITCSMQNTEGEGLGVKWMFEQFHNTGDPSSFNTPTVASAPCTIPTTQATWHTANNMASAYHANSMITHRSRSPHNALHLPSRQRYHCVMSYVTQYIPHSLLKGLSPDPFPCGRGVASRSGESIPALQQSGGARSLASQTFHYNIVFRQWFRKFVSEQRIGFDVIHGWN